MKPIKPKKLQLLKTSSPPQKCNCYNGKVKDWEDGPYPSYDWVTCECCNGTTFVSVERVNEGIVRTNESNLKEYERQLKIHNILKTIKLTAEQFETLWSYGFADFIKNYSKTGNI